MAGIKRAGLVAIVTGLTLMGAPASAMEQPPAAAGTEYGGYTEQDTPIVVTLTRSRTSIRTVGLCLYGRNGYVFGHTAHSAPAEPPLLAPGDHVVWRTRIAPNGAFRALGAARAYYGDRDGRFTYTLTGRVDGAVMQGTVRGMLALSDTASGDVRRTIAFPTQRWVARSAPGRVFAGTTAGRQPVVVELSKSGSKVATMRIPWSASSDFGSMAISETLRALRLDGGAYSGTWTEPYSREDGGRNVFDYYLSLRVSGFGVSGMLQVLATATSPAGELEGTFGSGVVRFTARSSSGVAAEPVRGMRP